jgi:RNA polymerase sigma-70 factor (ECF subfamily)
MRSLVLSQSDPGRADALGLAERIGRGDAEAFQSLVALYQPRVTRLAHRLLGWSGDVDDIVQDVFLAVLRHRGGYRRDASLWTWLTAITLNTCRGHRRRRQILRKLASAFIPHKPVAAADAGALEDEVAREVRAAVAALPARDREVIVLFYLEHRAVTEMSSLLGVSTNAIDVRLHRARNKLREALKRFMEQ